MNFLPNDRFYTENHFWILPVGDEITLGLTPRGAADLGELNFAELPQTGQKVSQGEGFGVVESVKSVQELLCPFSGTVVTTNPKVTQNPEIVNDSPLEDGWLVRLRPDETPDFSSLLRAEQYTQKWPSL